jgi:hypothetical protein
LRVLGISSIVLLVLLFAPAIVFTGDAENAGSRAAAGDDLNCSDFLNQAAAQAHLDADPSDPDGLDTDHDGVACESLPCPCGQPATATPSPSPSPPPAPTPRPDQLVWGDTDCGGNLTIGDAQKISRSLVNLGITQAGDCPAVGLQIAIGGTPRIWGDFDCVADVTIGDAQKLARHLIGLSVTHGAGCPALGSFVPRPEQRGLDCGDERWPVKTMSDRDAHLVNLDPQETTVDALRALPKPASLPNNGRIPATEISVFRVEVRAVEMKLQEDRDFHLVVADPSDSAKTMIVEFPDPECEGAIDSRVVSQMASARQDFVSLFGTPSDSDFEAIGMLVVLEGVGFFDFIHGQRGVAPNGIELHPVLRVRAD